MPRQTRGQTVRRRRRRSKEEEEEEAGDSLAVKYSSYDLGIVILTEVAPPCRARAIGGRGHAMEWQQVWPPRGAEVGEGPRALVLID